MCMTYNCLKYWLFSILIKNIYKQHNFFDNIKTDIAKPKSFCNILNHDFLFIFSGLLIAILFSMFILQALQVCSLIQNWLALPKMVVINRTKRNCLWLQGLQKITVHYRAILFGGIGIGTTDWMALNFMCYRSVVLNWVVQISCGQSRVLLRESFGMLKGNRLGNLVFDRLPLKEYKRSETWPLFFLLLPPLQFCMGARFRGRDLRETQGKYKYPYQQFDIFPTKGKSKMICRRCLIHLMWMNLMTRTNQLRR